MTLDLSAWAHRHGVSREALDDLHRVLIESATPAPGDARTGSEAAAMQAVRLEATHKRVLLWRNNNGALQDDAGRWVRFGLGNDSRQLNERFKSSDLIGIRAGGQFVAREIKAPGWRYTGTPREEAQLRYIELVRAFGGDAAFATGEGTL